MLQTTKFVYMKSLCTCDALLCMAHNVLSTLEMGLEAGMVQIDFCAAFDRVDHQGILVMLCSVGVGGSVICIVCCDTDSL